MIHDLKRTVHSDCFALHGIPLQQTTQLGDSARQTKVDFIISDLKVGKGRLRRALPKILHNSAEAELELKVLVHLPGTAGNDSESKLQLTDNKQ